MLFEENIFTKPITCELCQGNMIFKGIGEYRCEDCRHLEYDDYGKVRTYIEMHRGATVAAIEDAIGVKQKVIRQMLKEERFEITADSNVFLTCEVCGTELRSGKICLRCRAESKKNELVSANVKSMNRGIGMADDDSSNKGAKRFNRQN